MFPAPYTAVLYTSSLTTSAAVSVQNNFQGLILEGYIYRYTPRRYAPDRVLLDKIETISRVMHILVHVRKTTQRAARRHSGSDVNAALFGSTEYDCRRCRPPGVLVSF